MSNDIKYIEEFNKIEQFLRKTTGSGDNITFSELLTRANNNYIVNRYYSVLKEHAKLRNVISHKRGTEFFAMPTDLALLSITKIKKYLIKPKKVKELIYNTPLVLTPNTTIIETLKIIKSKGYSQFPVYDNNEYLGVITSNSIIMWFASAAESSGEIIEDLSKLTVSDLLKYNEELDSAEFISENITATEFISGLSRNKKSSIWIMTMNGLKNQKPKYIITAYDYDKLYEYLSIEWKLNIFMSLTNFKVIIIVSILSHL